MAKKLGTLKTKRLFLGTDSGGRGTEVTSSAAELNIMDGVTATATDLNNWANLDASPAELNLLQNMWDQFTTTFVDGTDGTGTVQLVFKDAAGVTMASPIAGTMWIADAADGTAKSTITSLVELTNGEIEISNTGAPTFYDYITSAAGLLGFTLTAGAADYYCAIIHPTGKIVTSAVLAITSI
jgi:hypothetical protein